MRACLDLLEPVLRTLSQVSNNVAQRLSPLPGNDCPYVEMLHALDDLWSQLLNRPMQFTTDGPHHGGRRYELIASQDFDFPNPAAAPIDHLLHWRLSRRDKTNRRYSALALLATRLLQHVLTMPLEENSCLDYVETTANEEYFEYLKERFLAKKPQGFPRKTLTKVELAALVQDVTDNGSGGCLLPFLREQHVYGDKGALTYLLALGRRWEARYHRSTGVYELCERLRSLHNELLPLPRQANAHQKAALKLAKSVLALYEDWPRENGFWPTPSLGAYCQKPEEAGTGQYLVDYYKLHFSVNDLTGRQASEMIEMDLNTGEVEESMMPVHARPDGTLRLDSYGRLVRDAQYQIPELFLGMVVRCFTTIGELEEIWADEICLSNEGAFGFETWFDPHDTLALRQQLGKWRHELTRPLENKPSTRLIDILGDE